MNFLKENKRFSFKIGEKSAWGSNYKTDIKENSNILTTVYYFENGLKVTNIAKKYDEYNAYEWVNYFENTSDKPTEIISELWDCDCILPVEHEDDKKWVAYFPDKETATKIYAPTGSTWKTMEFYCNIDEFSNNIRPNHILPGETKDYSASNGRSSEARAPFFNIHKNGKGYLFAIGWSGQWNCSVERTNDEITFKSKIEDTNFRIMPGESFRTSSVVMIPYQGDVSESQNIWRRFIKDKISPIGKGSRPKFTPVTAMLWGGMRTEEILKRIDVVNKNEIPVDCIWLDAGWYGEDTKPTPDEFEGDWQFHTGDWTVSPLIHPQGLKDVSKAIHDSGKKFLLWIEPERVIKSTPIAQSHPEYFLSLNTDNNNNLLLNLGNEDARKYCFDLLSEKAEELNIDFLRIDFNIRPLNYWRNGDSPERKGISEIKYVNGLYKLWDSLLEKFPGLLIDNCASGGRRIDFETMKRSVTLWRSDFACPANTDIVGLQCHNQCYNLWMPYSGTGTGRDCDEYRVRSAYSAGLHFALFYSEKEKVENAEEKIRFMKKYVSEAKKIRPYLSEDFYPLTDTSENLDIWCANQFNRPSENDGIVQVFRREKSPYETACFKLRGLDKNADYLICDIDGIVFTMGGDELTEKGLEINIPEKRTAKIFFYKKIVG